MTAWARLCLGADPFSSKNKTSLNRFFTLFPNLHSRTSQYSDILLKLFAMDSAQWRSIASPEMVELDSDFDLETGTVHVNSTNQLLQPTRLVTSVKERPPASHRSSMSSVHDRSDYLEDTARLRQWPLDSTIYDPKQMQSHSTHGIMDLPPHVYWKGNPIYYLTWESLGIAISICFLSMLLRCRKRRMPG
jgi:hypothetical protein